MIARFLGAVQFLTILPVRGGTTDPAAFFPIVGGMLGALVGVCTNGPLTALIAIALSVVLTGALHEDGLADVADAFRAGRTKERILEIMKDSRIGSYGGVALVFSVTLRWQALARFQMDPVLGAAAALALSRASLVALAGITPSVGSGLGDAFCRNLARSSLIIAIAAGAVIAVLCAQWRGVAMIAVSTALVLLARAYFVRRIGGVNGDCLGATCQIVETANLVILAWQPSF